MRPLVDARRRQGWRVTLVPGSGRVQLAEVELVEPAVLTVDYASPNPGGKTDNVAITTVETTIDEARRERELPSRAQGCAWPVPAGRSRIWSQLTGIDPLKVQVSIATGVAVTEVTPGELVSLVPAAPPVVFNAPPYARQVRVIALDGQIFATSAGVTWTQIANNPNCDLTVAAFSTISFTTPVAPALLSVAWTVTS
jgi:hypothetical protein